MTSEVKQMLHMKEGTGEISYAKCSYIQNQVLSMTKSIKEGAIKELYQQQRPTNICIADLGCSSSELNNMAVVFLLIEAVEAARRELGDGPVEYQVCLNDLPSNDFNTVFKSLPSFDRNIKELFGSEGCFGHCFVDAVPGSFYGRLFPINSLHFVHSSYSLHWLSQVPEGIEENKKNVCIARTSPPSVTKAYQDQHYKDFMVFLQCRSKEVRPGGYMILTCVGRDCNEPYSKSYYSFDLLATVLNDMVSEYLVEEEKLNSFNFPCYFPSESEIRFLVEREGSFTIKQVCISEVPWEGDHDSNTFNTYDFVKCVRSVIEPLLITHFGEAIMDEVFKRYVEIVRVSSATQNHAFTNVTVLMTRK